MCGLVAALQTSSSLSQDRIERALDVLHHRGPDERGSWTSPDGNFTLGHTRLSIIGLDNGHQPMHEENRGLAMVVNGELYGYRSIRRELQEQGHRFATDSDSKIALHLFARHGMEFAHHLRGEFAIVLADMKRKRLIAVRDRFGIKPLFYTVQDGNVFLASEVKALLALGVPARWNPHGFLADQFMIRTDETVFAGIYSVPPRCILIAEDGRVSIKRYWDTDFPLASSLAAQKRDDAETVAEFRAALEDATKERLVADVEVACYLLGGIDSCSVLGLAQQNASRPIRAFTITFDDQVYDKTLLAQKTAELTGANFEPVPVSQQNIADAFSDALWHSERNMFNGHGVAKFLLSKAVRDAGIKVVITGEGSDEILAGYPPSRRDMLLYNNEGQDPDAVARQMEELAAANHSSRGLLVADGERIAGLSSVEEWLGFVPSWLDAFGTTAAKLQPLLRPELADLVRETNPHGLFMDKIDVRGRLAGRDAVNQGLYLWTTAVLSNFILVVLADRMEMAHSIEGRVPFLDHKVAELASSLPVHFKIRGQREEWVLREACCDLLIPEVYDRPKHPFMSPPAKETGDAMAGFVAVQSKALDDQPFFDPAVVRALQERLPGMEPAQRAVAEAPLLSAVSTALLHQRFGMGA